MTEISISHRLLRSGTITIAGRQIPIRVCLFWVGVTFWIGNMIVQTDWAGITELRASLYFVAEMVVITSATRTITIDRVASVYCLGGAMMGVMWLVSVVFTSFVPSPDAVSRQFVVPILEESLKLAPVIFILWRHPASRSWTMGASDIMLMAATSGAGFGLVEEAYFHHALGPTRALDWFPLTRINGVTLTVGHGSWTSLAGATLGLALLCRPRKPLNYLLAGSGIFWSILDHSHHNYGVDRSGFSVDSFNFITGHGWFSLYFFILGAIAVVGTDLYAVRRMQSSRPQLKLQGLRPPENRREGNPLKALWAFLVERRALAYALFRCQRSTGLAQEKLTRLTALLERRLLKRPCSPVSPNNPTAAAAD
jgi:RsiW-degrading membrane proteinase PrsW (M82 family)